MPSPLAITLSPKGEGIRFFVGPPQNNIARLATWAAALL
jgi:hypothetical protein